MVILLRVISWMFHRFNIKNQHYRRVRLNDKNKRRLISLLVNRDKNIGFRTFISKVFQMEFL